MTYTPYVIEKFGGLNTSDDWVEIGSQGAVDLLNCDVDHAGRVRARDGYATAVTITSRTVTGLARFNSDDGTQHLIVSTQAAGPAYELRAYTPTGTLASNMSISGGFITGAEQIGTVSDARIYVANAGVDTLARWTGTAWSQPSGMPDAYYLSQTRSDRLVAARSPTDSIHRVYFSDAGDPETWNNTIDLAPGDGSGITGLAAWQDNVIAFKRERFFVFYSETTDASGNPVFNNRRIEGFGCVDGACVTGDEGVYFFDGRNVWVTAGDVPTRVSRPLDGYFDGDVEVFGKHYDPPDPAVKMSYAGGRLYLALQNKDGVTNAVGRGVFVFDPKIAQWTYYDLDMRGALADLNDGHGTITTYFPTSGAVSKFVPGLFDDAAAGVPLNWYYVTGRYDMGSPDRKVIRETTVTGTGQVKASLTPDGGAFTGQIFMSLTLGSPPSGLGLNGPLDVRWRAATRGTYFNLILANQTTGTGLGQIARVTHRVRGIEAPK